jgi:hypothetical protein
MTHKKDQKTTRDKRSREPLFPGKPLKQALSREEAEAQFLRNSKYAAAGKGWPVDPNQSVY